MRDTSHHTPHHRVRGLLFLLALLAGIILTATAIPPAVDSFPVDPAASGGRSISEEAAGSHPSDLAPAQEPEPHAGRLLCLVRGERVPMPLLDMAVTIDVRGIMSVARLTQRFENPADTTVEAVYVFPLPERAAVRHMELRVGDRRIVSCVREREEAKQSYDQAKREGRKAALIEQERPNLFTTSVANVNPGEAVDVVLEYVQEVQYEDGVFGITFPLTFTPRYIPDAQLRVEESTGAVSLASSTVSDAPRIAPPFREAYGPGAPVATFNVHIDGGLPLTDVRCLTHPVEVREDGDAWSIRPRAERVLADRDLRCTWRPAAGDVPRAALLTETHDGATYALFMLAPPDPEMLDGTAGLTTCTLFILDISGSMAGPSIEQARRALAAALDRQRPGDRFNILAFNQDQKLYAQEWIEATPREVARAQGWIQALEADGGTEIHPALLRGLSLFGPDRPDDVPRIVFLTDGAVGNEAEVLEDVASGLGAIRIHAIGIGHASNSYLIRKLAETGRGLATFVFDTATVERSVASFLAQIERPVLTGLALSWPGGSPAEMYPPRLPDLHAGQPLFVSLRWDGAAPERVEVRGQGLGETFTASVAASPAEGPEIGEDPLAGASAGAEQRLMEGGAIPTRWARAKVEDLSDRRLRGGDPDSLRADIAALGLSHHIVTPFTSLVAVEERITASGEAIRLPVANTLPHGSQLLGSLPSGGTLSPLRTLIATVLLVVGIFLLWALRRVNGPGALLPAVSRGEPVSPRVAVLGGVHGPI